MKKMKIALLVGLCFGLASCSQSPQVTDTSTSDVEEIVLSSQSPYKITLPEEDSPIRGIVVSSNTYASLDNMEEKLLELTPNYIATDNYYRAGQILTSTDAVDLLSSKLSEADYAELLKTDSDARNIGLNGDTNLVTTIVESDFYKGKNEDADLSAIAIGVGLDLTNYKKDSNGNFDFEQFSQHDGKIIANQIAQIIRSKENMAEVPIYFGFYQQSQSNLLPGVYIGEGYLDGSKQNLEEIKRIDQKYVSFLTDAGAQADSSLNGKLSSLKSDLTSYFGTNVSVSSVGFYQDDKLKHLEIKIYYDSNSKTKANSMISFLDKKLNKDLNINSDYTVSVLTTQEVPIGVIKKEGSTISKIVY